LFFSCDMTNEVWRRWDNLFDLSSALPHHAKEHFLQNSHGLQGNNANLWRQVGWCAIVWSIWN